MNRRKVTNTIVVHGALTPPDMDIGVDEIRQWHTDPAKAGGPYSDIGYHLVIRRTAHVEFGRALDLQGAHTPAKNAVSVGICLVGGRHQTRTEWQNNYTPAQFARLGTVIDWLQTLYPATVVTGHRDVQSGRDCPGFDVAAWWAARSF
jgi:N-acetylmuramoyl-L-alanine amidase